MQLLVAFGMAAILTPVLAWAGTAVGLVDRPTGSLKIHVRPVAVSGGIAVVAASLAGLAAAGWPDGLVVTAVGAALALGVVDDLKALPPWPRLVLLAGIGGILAIAGVELGPSGPWGAIGTILVTVACANAVNILDGQDGLVGGLGAIAALGLASLGAQVGASGATSLGLALTGALAGFLMWNRPPARVFLGDGGAYAVGVLLAAMAADVTAQADVPGLMAAGLCLGVFAFELIFSIVRRVRLRSLMHGDRLHSYDLMSLWLGNRWRVTVLYWLGGAATALAAQVVVLASSPVAVIAAAAASLAAAAWGVRLWSTVPREIS